jgi:uncharacterized protein YjbJ (UPF0337 family)
MWDKNEHNGKVDQAKGKVKQAAGTLTGVDDLKAESQLRFRGKVEAPVGRTSRKATVEAITRVGNALKR